MPSGTAAAPDTLTLLQELGDSDQGYQPIARLPDRRVQDHLVELVLGGELDPGRGSRVVTDTDSQICGCRLRTSAMTLLLPTPEGPERTTSRGDPGTVKPRSALELARQRRPLVRAETAHPTGRRDAEAFHDPL